MQRCGFGFPLKNRRNGTLTFINLPEIDRCRRLRLQDLR
jgi:hypothetical protein